MTGIVEAVLPKAIWYGLKALGARLSWRTKITITSPRSHESANDPAPWGPASVPAFRVEGTIRNIRKDHVIWILTEDENTGRIWPQSFYPVQINGGTWNGKFVVIGYSLIKIYAVVAPRTSQDFFRYYELVGERTGWHPLSRIPLECVYRAEVHVRLP